MQNVDRSKTRVAALSVLSNTVLVVLKLAVGLAIGSVSVLSEAIHSAMDLAAAVIAYLAVRISGKPADEEHPFGHGKFENLSGMAEALLIFGAAGWIIFEAMGRIRHPEPMGLPALGVAVMAFSVVVNLAVSQALFRVAERTDSIALKADAWHLRTDVYTSLGVLAGLVVIWLGSVFRPHLNLSWIDPLFAILVALLILGAAIRLSTESLRDLLDSSIPEDEVERIRQELKTLDRRIRGYHRIRTRRAGPQRFVQLHLLVDSQMTVSEGHALSHLAVRRIQDRIPGARVLVHIEPCDGRCDDECLGGCLLTPEERGNEVFDPIPPRPESPPSGP
jgi:cation diffusion facilitator family transporter